MSADVRQGKGFGYKHNNKICMIRCFVYGKENWAMQVASGYCAWCGYSPNKEEDANEITDTRPVPKDNQG